MSRTPSALALLLPLLAAAPALAAPAVEPGEWEQVMSIDAESSPHGAMKQTIRSCITSADAAVFTDRERWGQEMLRANPQAKCKLQDSKQDGSAITVVLACEGDLLLTVRQDFHGTRGTLDAETKVGGTVQSRNHIESKRVADTCSPETIERWKQQNPGKTFEP